MAFCIQCGSDLLVDEARFCPLCGAPQPRPGQGAAPGAAAQEAARPSPSPLSDLELPVYPDDADGLAHGALPGPPPAAAAPAPAAEPTVAARPPAAASPAAAAKSPSVAYFWRITAGDRIAAAGSLVVLISLFLPWFTGHVSSPAAGVGHLGHNVFISVRVRTDAMGAGGWHWLLLLLSAGIFVYVGLRTLPGENVRLPLPHRQILGLATGLQLGLALLSLLVPLTIGSWSPSYGAIIGVLAAAVAVLGAWLRRGDPEVVTQPPAPGEARRLWPERAERPARPPRPPKTERRRGRDAVTVVVPEDEPAPASWVSVPSSGAAPAAPAAPEGSPSGGRRTRRVAATQEYGVPGATGPARPGGAGAATRPPASPPPAQAPPPGDRDPYGPDDATATTALAARRPAGAGEDGPSEVVCAICGTTNTVTAKVCRTCGVVLVPRSERS